MMYLQIASKILIGALGVFIVFRIIGKKAISEVTPFDLLYVLVLSGILEESLYDDQVSVLHQVFALVLWAVVVYVVEITLQKTEKLTKTILSEPAVLISQGKLNMKELEKNRLDMQQLRTLLRQEGCYTINDTYYAILEVSGELTVIKKVNREAPSILLIENGVIDFDTLKTLEKNEEWLQNQLEEKEFYYLEEIVYCEWLMYEEQLIIYTEEDTISKIIRLDA